MIGLFLMLVLCAAFGGAYSVSPKANWTAQEVKNFLGVKSPEEWQELLRAGKIKPERGADGTETIPYHQLLNAGSHRQFLVAFRQRQRSAAKRDAASGQRITSDYRDDERLMHLTGLSTKGLDWFINTFQIPTMTSDATGQRYTFWPKFDRNWCIAENQQMARAMDRQLRSESARGEVVKAEAAEAERLERENMLADAKEKANAPWKAKLAELEEKRRARTV